MPPSVSSPDARSHRAPESDLSRHEGGFLHEALLYSGLDDFTSRTGDFIRNSVESEEPILVVVDAKKIDLLRSELGADTEGVTFADMAEVGQNPARIIPAWWEFVEQQTPGRRFRGVGEPIWAERSPEELVECERHEALLNLAFAGSPPWWLLCPYDTDALAPSVIEEALRNHPSALAGDERRPSSVYRSLDEVSKPFDAPLAEPPARVKELAFEVEDLSAVRHFASRHAMRNGLDPTGTDEFVMAVNEIAGNSIRHGGGVGVLRVWRDGDTLLCEIRDRGNIDQPLAGRQTPELGQMGGYGLWLANRLCDLVQVRSFGDRSVVRLHKRLPSTTARAS